jgi:hypothetical protein
MEEGEILIEILSTNVPLCFKVGLDWLLIEAISNSQIGNNKKNYSRYNNILNTLLESLSQEE